MKTTVFLLLFLVSIGFGADEFAVPMATDANTLLLTVKNNLNEDLDNVTVHLKEASEWLDFYSASVPVGTLASGESAEAAFEFRTFDTEPDRKGSAWFEMRADTGVFVRYYAVFFRAEPDTVKVLPAETGIDGLYPNPANPSTTLHYSLSQPSHIKIDLYNILGRQVRTLYNGNKQAGQWTVHWDGTNSNGLTVSSGVYFFKMVVQEESGKIRHIYKQKIMLQK